MIISPVTYGKPSGVVVTDVPNIMTVVAQVITVDDFDVPIHNVGNISFTDTVSTFDNEQPLLQYVADDQDGFNVQTYFLYDTPVVTHTDNDPDVNNPVYVMECDPYGTMEDGTEDDAPCIFDRFRSEHFWSNPPYLISGVVRDGAMLSPLPGADVRLFKSNSNQFMMQALSDASGAYALGVYDKDPYMVVAHVGNSPSGASRRDIQGS